LIDFPYKLPTTDWNRNNSRSNEFSNISDVIEDLNEAQKSGERLMCVHKDMLSSNESNTNSDINTYPVRFEADLVPELQNDNIVTDIDEAAKYELYNWPIPVIDEGVFSDNRLGDKEFNYEERDQICKFVGYNHYAEGERMLFEYQESSYAHINLDDRVERVHNQDHYGDCYNITPLLNEEKEITNELQYYCEDFYNYSSSSLCKEEKCNIKFYDNLYNYFGNGTADQFDIKYPTPKMTKPNNEALVNKTCLRKNMADGTFKKYVQKDCEGFVSYRQLIIYGPERINEICNERGTHEGDCIPDPHLIGNCISKETSEQSVYSTKTNTVTVRFAPIGRFVRLRDDPDTSVYDVAVGMPFFSNTTYYTDKNYMDHDTQEQIALFMGYVPYIMTLLGNEYSKKYPTIDIVKDEIDLVRQRTYVLTFYDEKQEAYPYQMCDIYNFEKFIQPRILDNKDDRENYRFRNLSYSPNERTYGNRLFSDTWSDQLKFSYGYYGVKKYYQSKEVRHQCKHHGHCILDDDQTCVPKKG